MAGDFKFPDPKATAEWLRTVVRDIMPPSEGPPLGVAPELRDSEPLTPLEIVRRKAGVPEKSSRALIAVKGSEGLRSLLRERGVEVDVPARGSMTSTPKPAEQKPDPNKPKHTGREARKAKRQRGRNKAGE